MSDSDDNISHLKTGNDILSVIYRLAPECIDYTILNVTEDEESAAIIMQQLHSFFHSFSIYTFMRVDTMRDVVAAKVMSMPHLYHYFQNLNHVLISNILAKQDIRYQSLVDKVMENITPTLTTDRKMSILDDKLFLEQNVNLHDISEILLHNSIILTIYFFKIAYVYTTVYETLKED